MSDIFDGGTNTDDNPQPPAWDELVGEGKKYRDPDAVAKAVFEKDRFIQRLQEENEEARNELRARTNLEELATQLSQARREDQSHTNRQQAPTPDDNPPQGEQQVDLEKEFEKLFNERVTKQTRSQNVSKSREAMKELYGADYETAILNASKELGVSKDYLLDMAATSPEGFTRVVQSAVKPDDNRPVTPPASSYTPNAGAPEGRKNVAYYNKMRKEDPKRYFSKHVQVEMHKEAVKQGDGFYSS